ncbi:MAG: hypothetical protein ACI9UT_000157 [Flavobacteriales bacterium]|jgi:hypothetical protein
MRNLKYSAPRNIAILLRNIEENGLFGDLKIARIVSIKLKIKDMIDALAAKLCTD